MSLLSFLLLFLAVVHANPIKRDSNKAILSISARINANSGPGFVAKERARLQAMRQVSHPSKLSSGSGSIYIPNSMYFYTAEIGVGTPPAYRTLLVDTGSSNTWVGASQPYVKTSSSVDTGNSVSVQYGSGAFSGEEWLDTVTLSSSLVITSQSIGAANFTVGVTDFDGILGLGPVDLTDGTVNNTSEVPTVTQNLYAQKKISQEELGVFFVPISESDNDGTLTFGGYDQSVIVGSVNYVPITTTQPSANFWGIDQSISYGSTTILSTTAGIIDTGSTMIFLATDAFNRYQSATGGVLDSNTGLLAITSAQYAKLQPLSFHIGSTTYDLPPNGQIWPRSLNTAIGGNSSAIYLIVIDNGSPSGSGQDFTNGYVFLERFYSVFDTANSRIGFAKTKYTDSTTN